MNEQQKGAAMAGILLLLFNACNGGVMNVGAPSDNDTGDSQTAQTDPVPDSDSAANAETDRFDAGVSTDSQVCSDGGIPYQSACWYLGGLNESCETACDPKGGYNPLTAAVVGAPDQGGDWLGCRDIVRLMGFDAEVAAGYRTDDSEGFGCHIWDTGNIWWLYSPDFSPTASIANAQIVCACGGDTDTGTD